jgi:hypothetical protein
LDLYTANKHIKNVKTKIVLFLNSPFDLFQSKKRRFITSLTMSGFVWFFLSTFGPFKFDTFILSYRLYYTGTYSLACFIIVLADLFILRDNLIKKTTMGSAFIWGFWIMFWIGFSNYMLTTQWYQWEEFSLDNFVKNQIYTLSLGVIITPFLILVNHIIVLRKRLMEDLNYRLASNYQGINQTPKELISIHSQYKDGKFETDINNLLYIKSSDNYIDVCYKNRNSVQHNLVRNTLAAVEKSIDHPALIRCHRSFINNKNYVRVIKRNAGRYKIIIETSNVEIPISRKYKNALFSSFGKEIVIRP